MKFSEYISKHHVFGIGDLLFQVDSRKSARTQLDRALASGTVERVRRGLYVSRFGRYEGVGVDPYEIVSALDVRAVLSYHSALEAHGIAHNVGFECSFRTDAARSPFSFSGITYKPYPSDSDVPTQKVRGRAFGSILVTSREQTIIDCMKHPERSGGIEEVVRSLSTLPYIDVNEIVELALGESASMAARVGWLLDMNRDRWRVPEERLEALRLACRSVSSKLDKNSSTTRGWSQKWQMRLPESDEEVESWTT